ncbi:MAG: hypothetical protein E7Z86_05720 [Methanosphaera stadtmanae]|jgi:hypothetical protein|nr:hypothetical protein [Methanosphaera stadtmanae]
MNQVNNLVNKIKDDKIAESKNENIDNDEVNDSISHLTEDNLDEYLETVELDEHSKVLIDRYLAKKSKK